MPDEPIPLNWEDLEQQFEATGVAKAIPVDWQNLFALADYIEPYAITGFESSNVLKFAFLPAPREGSGVPPRLFVWFHPKDPRYTRYAYDWVDEEEYKGMIAAESKGTYLNEKIKPGRTYHNISPGH